MKTNRAVIIGAGISGLAVARRLVERRSILGRPFEILLLDATDRVGGTIATNRRDGYLLESGPDCFISEKKRGVGLCEDLGLRKELQQTRMENRRSFIARGTKLYPVPSGFFLLAPSKLFPILQSPILSWSGKWRLLKEMTMKAGTGKDETLGSFVRRRMGPEVLERLAQPLAGGIYAADPDQLSLQATFPQFLDMEKKGSVIRALMAQADEPSAQASGARYSLFVTLRAGLQTLTNRLGELLGPEVLRLNVSVAAVQPTTTDRQTSWQITLADGQRFDADAVCLALPSYQSAKIIYGTDLALSQALAAIPYTDSITAHFAYPEKMIKHPMNGFGFVVPAVEKRTITACTFVHRKFEGRAPEGMALLRAFTGGKTAQAIWSRSDTEIQDKLLKDLRELLGTSGAPIFSAITRYRSSLPQYTLGHLERLQTIDHQVAQWPGLALAGNWRNGVGLPDCIEGAERVAENLIRYLCQI